MFDFSFLAALVNMDMDMMSLQLVDLVFFFYSFLCRSKNVGLVITPLYPKNVGLVCTYKYTQTLVSI